MSTLLNARATPYEIIVAYWDLHDAREALEPIDGPAPFVPRSQLSAALNRATPTFRDVDADPEGYVPPTGQDLIDAYNNALAVLLNARSPQEDINEAYRWLANALRDLDKIPPGPTDIKGPYEIAILDTKPMPEVGERKAVLIEEESNGYTHILWFQNPLEPEQSVRLDEGDENDAWIIELIGRLTERNQSAALNKITFNGDVNTVSVIEIMGTDETPPGADDTLAVDLTGFDLNNPNIQVIFTDGAVDLPPDKFVFYLRDPFLVFDLYGNVEGGQEAEFDYNEDANEPWMEIEIEFVHDGRGLWRVRLTPNGDPQGASTPYSVTHGSTQKFEIYVELGLPPDTDSP
jgi:hypothetical protein